MNNQNINIKRSYFKKDKYGRIIDNSFQQLGDVFVTSSIGDFYSNYLSLLLSMTPEQHALFYNGSLPYSKFDTTDLLSSEIERLRALVNESLENKELRNNNTPKENPVIPNGSFFRTGPQDLVGKDKKVSLSKGSFYYVQEGIIRKCDSYITFINLFRSITNLNPYKKEVLENNVPYVGDTEFINSFNQGKPITKESLGKERYEDEPENTTGYDTTDCRKYGISSIYTEYTVSYVDCSGTNQTKTTSPNVAPVIIYALAGSVKSITGNGFIYEYPDDSDEEDNIDKGENNNNRDNDNKG